MTDRPPPPVALRHRRDATIAILCEHFALDHLETAELEALIDGAHAATTPAELDALLEGLPPLAPAPAPVARTSTRVVPGAGGTRQQLVVAIMGGAERKGAWSPGEGVNVVSLMGGVLLDFRQAELRPGITRLIVLAVMGGVEIVVPPELRVESSGIGIMGGFEQAGSGRFPVDSSAPVLRVTGLAFMGGVEITRRPLPGAPSDDWAGETDRRGPLPPGR